MIKVGKRAAHFYLARVITEDGGVLSTVEQVISPAAVALNVTGPTLRRSIHMGKTITRGSLIFPPEMLQLIKVRITSFFKKANFAQHNTGDAVGQKLAGHWY